MLVAFDLDGTLISFGKSLSDENLRALNAAAAAGHILAIASGRALSAIPRELLKLPCFSYCISSGGAVLSIPATGEFLLEKAIPHETVLTTMENASGQGAAMVVTFAEKEIYDVKWMRHMLRSVKKMGHKGSWWKLLAYWLRSDKNRQKGKQLFIFSKNLRRRVAKAREPIYKIECAYTAEALCMEQQALFARSETLEAIITPEQIIEITAKGADKGTALSALAERLEIPKERIIAFGDSNNDLPMRPAAGIFVVMENSGENALKAVADHIAPPVEEDGAAKMLHKLLALDS